MHFDTRIEMRHTVLVDHWNLLAFVFCCGGGGKGGGVQDFSCYNFKYMTSITGGNDTRGVKALKIIRILPPRGSEFGEFVLGLCFSSQPHKLVSIASLALLQLLKTLGQRIVLFGKSVKEGL